MLQELKALSKQLNWIGLSVRANYVDLMIRSIAGDTRIDSEIELAISELIRTANLQELQKIQEEIANLLMLHGDYTKFLNNYTVDGSEDNFYIRNSNYLKLTESTDSPEKAVALLLIKQGIQ